VTSPPTRHRPGHLVECASPVRAPDLTAEPADPEDAEERTEAEQSIVAAFGDEPAVCARDVFTLHGWRCGAEDPATGAPTLRNHGRQPTWESGWWWPLPVEGAKKAPKMPTSDREAPSMRSVGALVPS
jgi:hypothetical protein